MGEHAQFLISQGIAPSTARVCDSGKAAYLALCTHLGMPPFPASEDGGACANSRVQHRSDVPGWGSPSLGLARTNCDLCLVAAVLAYLALRQPSPAWLSLLAGGWLLSDQAETSFPASQSSARRGSAQRVTRATFSATTTAAACSVQDSVIQNWVGGPLQRFGPIFSYQRHI